MTSKLTLSAIALLIAAPAFATETQLQLSAGVEPGIYSVAELGAIANAETAAEAARLKAFFAAEGDSVVSRADYSTTVSGEPIRHGGADDR